MSVNSIHLKIQTLQEKYDRLKKEYEPMIALVQGQANSLATEFKTLFSAASNAYSTQEKALAKQLSVEGRMIENQCKALNNDANRLREDLKQILDEINRLRNESRVLKEKEVSKARKQKKINLLLNGIAKNNLPLKQPKIHELLEKFSELTIDKIDRIDFNKDIFWKTPGRGYDIVARGMTQPLANGKYEITICKQDGENDEEKGGKMTETLVHEIGHVIYDSLDDGDKADWFSMSSETPSNEYISLEASENEEEDFAECFRFYLLLSNDIKRARPKKYKFVDKASKIFLE